MNETVQSRQQRVAIVGTGLAGLTTAHLLQNDPEQRFAVTLLEQADSLSFDSASVAVESHEAGTVERVDLPMRASAGGYYANLNRMYRHLEVPMHPVRFLFVFSKASKQSGAKESTSQTSCRSPPASASAVPDGYFIHASNLHQLPPPRPSGYSTWRYLLEVLYLVICHAWFRAACFLVKPHDESFAEYLESIWLPRRYITHYILPLMSSVSTCTHDELLAFPASDLVHYIRFSYGQQHYTVCGGVQQVQSRLSRGIEDIRVRSRVLEVCPQANGRVLVRWRDTDGVKEDVFDRTVLAVSPDVASRLFAPLRTAGLDKIPTTWVESSVLTTPSRVHSLVDSNDQRSQGKVACMHHTGTAVETDSASTQVITLRTQFSGASGARSEALHTMPSGVVVSTCPLDGESEATQKRTLKTAGFRRTLRTVESRATVERIMGGSNDGGRSNIWVNGENNLHCKQRTDKCDHESARHSIMVSWLSDHNFMAGLLVGAAATVILLIGTTAAFLLSRDQYGLDHWKLNVQLPVRSMWMNLGYWTSSSEFPEACRSYLHQVFSTADILTGPDSLRSIAILDVGIGCGDQTRTVIESIDAQCPTPARSLAYVGITINQAQQRVALEKWHTEPVICSGSMKLDSFHLFCADASKPHAWSEEVRSSVEKLHQSKKSTRRWLLASDCLYHFSPSRMPLWQYAARNVGMNFMGSDLCLSTTATWRQTILARMIGVLMGCPWKAFLTEEEYREQLMACGYDRESIIIKDVSEDVFPGLVAFLEKQDQALARSGISLGAGFRLARRVFGWFAVSKVVRAVIVVARLPAVKDDA
ncbi:hypothetical protein QBC36DRAFT_377912 [Triangularia setosa]|uniref:Amine oxidase domain-containing protein n=1 Tax=Triangularia setosa TaxID=2587417 RepID=A0AAN6W8D4_9PEZI|nr:hypothetical protein QBC36DRAFT_377912 [Podospora setosa]